MRHWQRDLDYISLVGPDEPRFAQAVKRIDEYIERLEEAVQLLALDGLVDPHRVTALEDE